MVRLGTRWLESQVPPIETDDVVDFDASVFVGYRGFEQHGLMPAYPFGHGLSYARFAYRRLRVSGGTGDASAPRASERVTVTIPRRSLSYWDSGSQHWVTPAGRVPVYVGSSSQDVRLAGVVHVRGPCFAERVPRRRRAVRGASGNSR